MGPSCRKSGKGHCGTLPPENMSLAGLVSHYIRRHRPRIGHLANHLKSFRTLEDAIWNGAGARTWDGKCDPHQRRIGNRRLSKFAAAVVERKKEIRRCRDFDELLVVIESARFAGIGKLAIYDAAVRIGVWFGQRPRQVHLHAGTTVGAKALGLPTRDGVLSVKQFPKTVQRLSACEIEDFLCIYKDVLRRQPRSHRSATA